MGRSVYCRQDDEGEGQRAGGSTRGIRATRPAATSICAVVITFSVLRATRGMQPRINCAARRPLTTANSNGLEPAGRRITGTFRALGRAGAWTWLQARQSGALSIPRPTVMSRRFLRNGRIRVAHRRFNVFAHSITVLPSARSSALPSARARPPRWRETRHLRFSGPA
jgi:hypothetical protein